MEGEQRKRTKLRHLRTILLVSCVVSVLVVSLLWVRSREAEDRLSGHITGSEGFRIYSSRGCLVIYTNETPDAARKYPWRLDAGAPFWLEPRDSRVSRVPKIMIQPQVVSVTLPHWFLVIVLAAVALAAPRVGRRFSLRGLLLTTTFIAVILGLVRWMR